VILGRIRTLARIYGVNNVLFHFTRGWGIKGWVLGIRSWVNFEVYILNRLDGERLMIEVEPESLRNEN
jgi:hypothetical protein